MILYLYYIILYYILLYYTSVGTFHINGMCFVDPREKFIQREEWILSACCDR